jgi:hypothetical protein
MSAGKLFQTDGPATANDRELTVERRVDGVTRRSVEADLKERRPGRSDTRQSGPRYIDWRCFMKNPVCQELAVLTHQVVSVNKFQL